MRPGQTSKVLSLPPLKADGAILINFLPRKLSVVAGAFRRTWEEVPGCRARISHVAQRRMWLFGFSTNQQRPLSGSDHQALNPPNGPFPARGVLGSVRSRGLIDEDRELKSPNEWEAGQDCPSLLATRRAKTCNLNFPPGGCARRKIGFRTLPQSRKG